MAPDPNTWQGYWYFTMGAGSSLNLLGKTVLFPLWLYVTALVVLFRLLFEKRS